MNPDTIQFRSGQVWRRADGTQAFLVLHDRDPWVEIKCWRGGQLSDELVLARGELARHVIERQLEPSPMV